jgi:hypothetical protein
MARLTNAFSKKMEDHAHAMALHFMYYNFRPDSSNAQDDARNGRWSEQAALGDGRYC